MTAPRHKVLVGGARGAGATYRAFPAAVKRRLVDRTRADVQAIGDYARNGASDLAYINAAIVGANAVYQETGKMVKLSLEGRDFNIGFNPIIMLSGVELDLAGSIITHTRKPRNAGWGYDGSVTALSATGQSNFAVLGGTWIGPASWWDTDPANGQQYLRASEAYAFRLTDCSDFVFDTYYEDGNAGLQLQTCTRLTAKLHSLNLNGANIKLIGGSFMTLASDVTNSRGFGIKCESGVNNVTVLYTRKRVDETKIDPDRHPGIVAQLEPIIKRAPFQVLAATGITWSASNGGELTIPVTRDPTVATLVNPWAPPLVPEGDVRLYRVANVVTESSSTVNRLNADYKVKRVEAQVLSGNTVVTPHRIVCYCPVQPLDAYTSSGYVADKRYIINALGEEAIACSVPSFKINIHEVYAHRIGDAGISIMGNDIYVDVLEARECRLSSAQSSGKGNRVNKIISYNNGNYTTHSFTYGGFASFVSSAGNYSENSSYGKIVSVDDIGGGARWVFASTDKPFEPDGVCESLYMSVPSLTGIPNEYWIFGCRPAPDKFGPDSVPGQGLAPGENPAFPNGIPPFLRAPTDNEIADGIEAYHWDGANVWRYTATFVGNAAPIAPTNCRVDEIFLNGPGVYVQDQIGYGYGNSWPYQYAMNDSPYAALLNGDFEYWPPGTGVINLTDTARCEGAVGGNPAGTVGNLGVWFAAREHSTDLAPTATMSRVAGRKAPWAIKLHRLPNTSAMDPIFFGFTITDPEKLRDLVGKPIKLTLQAWWGATPSDQNLSFNWALYSRNAYAPLDYDMAPTGTGSSFASGSARVYDTSRPVEIISTAVLPADSKQLIGRISWTPRIGVASRIAMVGRGAGYTSIPTVTFEGGGSHPDKVLPRATAHVSGGKVSSISIDTGWNGSNLEAAPTVVLTGGGATTAANAVCVVPLLSDTEDYLAIERICLGPADKTSLWKREALDVTVSRLTHNTYLIDNP